jgi:hypothetical protein
MPPIWNCPLTHSSAQVRATVSLRKRVHSCKTGSFTSVILGAVEHVPVVDHQVIHVGVAEAAEDGIFGRVFGLQEVLERADAALAAARFRLGLKKDVIEEDLVRFNAFHADA